MKLILYGYYNYKNFGDDLFYDIISNYLIYHKIEYVTLNPSNIQQYNNYIDFVLFGGGEVINDFFMFPLIEYMKKYDYKFFIYGMSIGCINSIKLLDIFNICILRNNFNFVNLSKNILYDNDIVFNIKDKYNIDITNTVKNTIGYYLISDIGKDKFNQIIDFTDKIKLDYHINFVLFHDNNEMIIIKNIIDICNLKNYTILDLENNYNKLKSILSNEKHFCLRFHSHVICYTYNVNFISFPLTNKTIEFNTKYNIEYSYDPLKNLYLLNNQNIKFINIKYNYNNFDLIFNDYKKNIYNYINKSALWIKIKYIYDNFINLLSDNKLINNNIQYYQNIINDQIELCIFNKLDTKYKYGITEKINYIYNNKNILNKDIVRKLFIEIITNII